MKDGITFDKEAVTKNLTLFLYPDDSDEAGNLLRIYQQYFMVSNAAHLILKEMREKKYDLRRMYDHAVIQINDTHPTMIIPELIRILVEEKAFSVEEAMEVVSRTCAYTNHTILAEALEKWPLAYLEKVVPQLVPYIKEMDKRVAARFKDPDVQIIDKDGRVHMARIDIHYGFSVNGVAAIHTEILKNTELKLSTRSIRRNLIIRPMELPSVAGCFAATENCQASLRTDQSRIQKGRAEAGETFKLQG